MTRRNLLLSGAILLLYSAHAGAQPDVVEAASVRLIPRDKAGLTALSPFGGAVYTAKNVSLAFLIEMGYGVDESQISGVDRLGTDAYEVSIKPESGRVTYERLKPMMKALLIERFRLATHDESKEVEGYGLVAAKSGPKLQESQVSGDGSAMIYAGGLSGTAVTLDVLASMLARPAGRPVTNKTGIAGKYDVKLSYAPDTPPSTAAASDAPSFFAAVQEQLGLKLEPRKVPLRILVIDHCERVPTEN